MLFDGIVFGPIQSRRLGSSLGINLLPANSKLCTFNCLYCECGFNFQSTEKFPDAKRVIESVEKRLQEMIQRGESIDSITFAGNGEPTLYPDFGIIIDEIIRLRNYYFSQAKISVLSNATRISDKSIFNALNKVDYNILKIDSAIEDTLKTINQPVDSNFSLLELIENFRKFNSNLIIQTLFLSGEYHGKVFDNTTDREVDSWLKMLQIVRPKQVMVYSLDRKTPVDNLVRASKTTLHAIASRVKELGIAVHVTE